MPQCSDYAGALSIASGAAMLVVPGRASVLYGLPRIPMLVRVLAIRDLAIGGGLLRNRVKRRWWLARAMADAIDMVLIAGVQWARCRRFGSVRVAGAGGLASVGVVTALYF